MQEFVIESFKEELIEAVNWHAIAIISGSKEKQQETIRKLDEAYACFRYIESPKEQHGN